MQLVHINQNLFMIRLNISASSWFITAKQFVNLCYNVLQWSPNFELGMIRASELCTWCECAFFFSFFYLIFILWWCLNSDLWHIYTGGIIHVNIPKFRDSFLCSFLWLHYIHRLEREFLEDEYSASIFDLNNRTKHMPSNLSRLETVEH